MNEAHVFTQDYTINTTVTDSTAQLSLAGVLNLIQDVSILHAEEIGQGYQNCLSKEFFWVLSQQSMRIYRWPKRHEILSIKTWIKDIGTFSSTRECSLFVGDEVVGHCSILMICVDTNTRRPKRITNDINFTAQDTGCSLDFKSEKIPFEKDKQWAQITDHVVKISELDMNQHVNNTKYAELFINSLSKEAYQNSVIESYEINFLTESLLGDRIHGFSNTITDEDNKKSEITYYGKRCEDDKRIFIARLGLSAKL